MSKEKPYSECLPVLLSAAEAQVTNTVMEMLEKHTFKILWGYWQVVVPCVTLRERRLLGQVWQELVCLLISHQQRCRGPSAAHKPRTTPKHILLWENCCKERRHGATEQWKMSYGQMSHASPCSQGTDNGCLPKEALSFSASFLWGSSLTSRL